MFGSFSGNRSESESKRDPWAPAIPYIKEGMASAAELAGRGPYQGDFWVDPNQIQLDAINGGVGMTPQQLAYAQQMGGFGQQMMSGFPGAMDFYQGSLQGSNAIANPYQSDRYGQIIQENAWTDQDQASLDAALQAVDQQRQMAYKDNRLGASLSGVEGGSDALRGYAQAAEGAANTAGQLTSAARSAGLSRAYGQAGQWAGNQLGVDQGNRSFQAGAAGTLGQWGQAGLNIGRQGVDFANDAWQNQAGWGDYRGGFDRERMVGQQQQWGQPWDDVNNAWNIYAMAGGLGGTTKTSGSSAGATFGFGSKE